MTFGEWYKKHEGHPMEWQGRGHFCLKCEEHYEEPKRAAPIARRDETAWLIEHRPGCTWWDGRSTETFTPDPNDCVRFARKEDAERVLMNVVAPHNRAACIVTEHLWCMPHDRGAAEYARVAAGGDPLVPAMLPDDGERDE